MSSVCAEQQHKLLLSLKKSLRAIDVDIPPRKLLLTRAADMFSDEDPYSSDQFRMYEFKVRRCTRSRSHDWTDCPFAHPGEKARRRDPRRHLYSSDVCPAYRRGNCSRGDACEFSHGVFECWLHPARYRTEACKDGKNCKRKVCFFAHTPRQLRVLPPQYLSSSNNNNNNIVNNKSNNSCSFCRCCCSSSSATCSPTSTLFGVSHFASSPPLSPSSSSSSPTLSRFVGPDNNHHHHHHGVSVVSSKLNELMCSLEGMSFGEANNSPVSASKLPWLDVSLCREDQHHTLSPSAASSFGCEDHNQHRQQFILSPSINSASFSNGKYYSTESKVVDDVTAAPDLGWVNDLLM